MSMFKDNNDREWTIAINVPTIKAVREIDIDLGDETYASMDRLSGDVVLLVNVLWLLCENQAKAINVTEEQFGEALVGDAIERAVIALMQARVDFSHGQRKSLLQAAIKATSEVRETAYDLALAKLESPELKTQVQKAMTTRMDAEIKKTLTRLSSATSSPEPPE